MEKICAIDTGTERGLHGQNRANRLAIRQPPRAPQILFALGTSAPLLLHWKCKTSKSR